MAKLPGFGGKPFFFWTLTPIVLLFVYGMTSQVEDWHSVEAAVVLGLDAVCVLGLLVLYNPHAFHWAARLLALVVFAVYATYVGAELAGRVQASPGAHASPRWAIVGLIVYGAPALWFALFGGFPAFLEWAWAGARAQGGRRAAATPPPPLTERDAVLQAALDAAPGPSPWYFRDPRLVVPGARGELRWSDAGPGSDHAGKSVLRRNDGSAVAIVGFQWYMRVLPGQGLLLWHAGRSEDPDAGLLQLVLLDVDALEPIPDVDAACAAMESTGSHYRGGEVVTARLPTTLPPGLQPLALPPPLDRLEELLVLAETAPGDARGEHMAVLALRPRQRHVEVLPQDWFNQGAFDYMYQWITRITRHPETGALIGDGIRLFGFELDESGRQLARRF